MRQNKATSLKDFLLAYNNKKTDMEISQMLSIPIEQIKREKEKIFTDNTEKTLETISCK
ncbi:MAG: hypothetical protein ACOX0L_08535 [Natronincolaceae bacterium]|jgi:hypothetical protein|nr:hypothetical protein [Bacillota bacterium]